MVGMVLPYNNDFKARQYLLPDRFFVLKLHLGGLEDHSFCNFHRLRSDNHDLGVGSDYDILSQAGVAPTTYKI